MIPRLLIGAALGGAAMYLFDPDQGRRRRALLGDQAVRASRKLGDTADAGMRDLSNRAGALPRQAKAVFGRGPVTDQALTERVRSKMGRYVAHPAAVEVNASEGRITLSGAILAHEHKALLRVVQAVSGVKEVIDQLAVHETAEGVSELQGDGTRPGERTELLQGNWSPGTRLVTGTAATLLALYGARNRGMGRAASVAGAAALMARTITNKPIRQVAGLASGDSARSSG